MHSSIYGPPFTLMETIRSIFGRKKRTDVNVPGMKTTTAVLAVYQTGVVIAGKATLIGVHNAVWNFIAIIFDIFSLVCNVTIVSEDLRSKSGKSFGQIKSPSLEGPDSCIYTFAPNENERVEIQIYRLVNVGRHNGTSCNGGFLQLSSGTEPQYTITDSQICGRNERFAPPVVFFADDGITSLLFQITEKTSRSQFLAYFSFTSKNNPDGLGYKPKGGMRLQNTDCDWLYQDFACNKTEQSGSSCILASPGYPGVYPPNRQCKYHITSNAPNVVHVRITFIVLSLPTNCKSDYITIYQGSTRGSPLLTKFCGNQRKTLDYSGTNLLLEFNTGPQRPPFEFNGFVAKLKFSENLITDSVPTAAATNVTENRILSSTISQDNIYLTVKEKTPPTHPTKPSCDIIISGNNTRSGYFDSKNLEWNPICHLIFNGRLTDVVHISLSNYTLRASGCKSVIEITDNRIGNKKNTLEKICSPTAKYIRDPDNVPRKTFLSTGNSIIITLRRAPHSSYTKETEFVSGAYFFHDEQLSGTMVPKTLCDVKYNGATSPLAGMIDNPGGKHFLKSTEGPLVCKQQFVPSVNQSITIKVQNIKTNTKENVCSTQCGDYGCRCVSRNLMKNVDHLMLLAQNNLNVACLCGTALSEWLPVSVRTWGSLSIVYSIAKFDKKQEDQFLSASYAFSTDALCGDYIYTLHSGEIAMKTFVSTENVNNFYYQSCTWTLHSNVERQLELDVSSTQNRPCTAWNITVHDYDPDPHKQHLGSVLYTFCPRDSAKLFMLPWKLNTVVVRLLTISRTLPQFKIKWKSQVIRARYPSSPAPNAISQSNRAKANLLGLFNVLFFLRRLCLIFKFRIGFE